MLTIPLPRPHEKLSWAELRLELLRLMAIASRATRGIIDDPTFGPMLAKRDPETLHQLLSILREIDIRE